MTRKRKIKTWLLISLFLYLLGLLCFGVDSLLKEKSGMEILLEIGYPIFFTVGFAAMIYYQQLLYSVDSNDVLISKINELRQEIINCQTTPPTKYRTCKTLYYQHRRQKYKAHQSPYVNIRR
jgi:hypothetical protein